MEDIQRRLRTFILSGRGSRQELFEEIYRTFAGRVRLYIRLRLPDSPEQCDDLTQAVFFKIYTGLTQYNAFYSLNTWIYTIAHNVLIDHVRTESRSREKQSKEADLIDKAESHYGDPLDHLITSETNRIIGEFMKQLSGNDRQIAFLRFYEGLPIKRISRVLEIPAGTVKYRIYSIRRRLKRRLEEEDED
ncbi:MAG: RNA polymerase sigma factor [Sediminispirochaetaceae bacterium]